jgi:hypothetical protein
MREKKIFLLTRYKTPQGAVKSVNLSTGSDMNALYNRENLLNTHYLAQIAIKEAGSVSVALPSMCCFLDNQNAILRG